MGKDDSGRDGINAEQRCGHAIKTKQQNPKRGKGSMGNYRGARKAMRVGMADILDTTVGLLDRPNLAKRREVDIAYLEGNIRALRKKRCNTGEAALMRLKEQYAQAIEAQRKAGDSINDPDGTWHTQAKEMLARWGPNGWRMTTRGHIRSMSTKGWPARSPAQIAYTEIEGARTGRGKAKREKAADIMVWAARAGSPEAKRTNPNGAIKTLRVMMVG